MEAKDLRDIKLYLMLHGHDDMGIFEVDDTTLEYIKKVVDLPVKEFDGVFIPGVSKRLSESDARYFLGTKLVLNRIGYLSDKVLLNLIKNNDIKDVESLIRIYNLSPTIMDPFALPVEYSLDKLFAGSLETQILVIDDESLYSKILPNINVYFNKIYLSKHITDITTACYIHELMHAQLEQHKGSIVDFYNSEVYSIFMELLYAYENNSLSYDVILSNRINHLIMSFNNMYLYQTEQTKEENYQLFDYCVDGKYLVSIVKAFQLLDLYIHADIKVKREILAKLQSVIDGELTVEDSLEHFDVSFENGLDSNIIHRLIKR